MTWPPTSAEKCFDGVGEAGKGGPYNASSNLAGPGSATGNPCINEWRNAGLQHRSDVDTYRGALLIKKRDAEIWMLAEADIAHRRAHRYGLGHSSGADETCGPRRRRHGATA